MKYCIQCGQVMPDHAQFCAACGAASAPTTSTAPTEEAEERSCLDNLRSMLRGEYLAWCISTWVLLGFTVLLVLFFCLFSAVFSSYMEPGLPELGLLFALFALYLLVLLTPCIVVGFVMTSRSRYYLAHVYDRPEEVLARCGHAGIIVLGAFFNTIALVFIIINFVRCKTRRQVFERILARRSQQ